METKFDHGVKRRYSASVSVSACQRDNVKRGQNLCLRRAVHAPVETHDTKSRA
jgi:hypothetical protein